MKWHLNRMLFVTDFKGRFMNPHHYLAILIRLFAIGLFIFSISQSSYFFYSIVFGVGQGFEISALQIFMSFFLPFVISVVLWFFPVIVAKSILKPEIDQAIKPINKDGISFLIIATLGLYVTFYALVDTVYYFSLWQISELSDGYGTIRNFFPPDVKANIWATLIELVLGVLLILKSKTIVKKVLEIAK